MPVQCIALNKHCVPIAILKPAQLREAIPVWPIFLKTFFLFIVEQMELTPLISGQSLWQRYQNDRNYVTEKDIKKYLKNI